MTGEACVYQKKPDTANPDVMSLAWFAKAAAPTTTLQFDWTIDYSFVWSETGQLRPGVMFNASQSWPADLATTNQVEFARIAGAYTFQNQVPGPQEGSLYIQELGNIPANQASVGIGMSGSGTFAVQAQPNLTEIFTPSPRYFITFGSFTQGEVLNITRITNEAEIVFPPNVFSMTAILQPDNTWIVRETNKLLSVLVTRRLRHFRGRAGVLISPAAPRQLRAGRDSSPEPLFDV